MKKPFSLNLENHWHIVGLLCLPLLIYFKNPAVALLLAMMMSLLAGKRLGGVANKLSNPILQLAIILLGFTLNIQDVLSISRDYSAVVSTYVLSTLFVGLFLGYLLKVDSVTSKLTTSGTAICGGTTVASLSPILRATSDQTGLVMAMIFLFNAVAIFIYPIIGHWLGLSETVFGIWSALSIHDTSSVVVAAAFYGDHALEVATTVKLGRTLWIIPLLVVFSLINKHESTKLRIPLFVVFFVFASILGTNIDLEDQVINMISWISKSLLVIALFFIGSQIDLNTLKKIRGKAFIQAFVLWISVAVLSLTGVLLVI